MGSTGGSQRKQMSGKAAEGPTGIGSMELAGGLLQSRQGGVCASLSQPSPSPQG